MNIILLSNNKSNILLIIKIKSQNHTKHINIIYYFVKKIMKNREIKINWVLKLAMLVDTIIKNLLAQQFKKNGDF